MKFCPRCGHPITVREVDGRERPACTNCRYVAYLNPALVGGVLATDESGRVLLVQRGEEPARGKWGLPAGYMEPDETAEECARRECLEETGLEVRLEGLWGIWSYRHRTTARSGVLLIYRAQIVGGKLAAATDAAAVRLYEPSEIPFDQVAFHTHIEALERYVHGV